MCFQSKFWCVFCIADMTSQLQKCHLDSLFAMFAACRLFCRNIKKSTSSFIFWELFVQISHHILQRLRPPKNESKCLPKWSLWAPKISKIQENRALQKTSKTQHSKSRVSDAKWSHFGTSFSWPEPPWNHKKLKELEEKGIQEVPRGLARASPNSWKVPRTKWPSWQRWCA